MLVLVACCCNSSAKEIHCFLQYQVQSVNAEFEGEVFLCCRIRQAARCAADIISSRMAAFTQLVTLDIQLLRGVTERSVTLKLVYTLRICVYVCIRAACSLVCLLVS